MGAPTRHSRPHAGTAARALCAPPCTRGTPGPTGKGGSGGKKRGNQERGGRGMRKQAERHKALAEEERTEEGRAEEGRAEEGRAEEGRADKGGRGGAGRGGASRGADRQGRQRRGGQRKAGQRRRWQLKLASAALPLPLPQSAPHHLAHRTAPSASLLRAPPATRFPLRVPPIQPAPLQRVVLEDARDGLVRRAAVAVRLGQPRTRLRALPLRLLRRPRLHPLQPHARPRLHCALAGRNKGSAHAAGKERGAGQSRRAGGGGT
ncbi:unnamed protein product [Closterium sp. NIES-53]